MGNEPKTEEGNHSFGNGLPSKGLATGLTDEEIRDKLQSIYNRCVICIYLLDMKKFGQLPDNVSSAIVTALEDICQDYQDLLDNCIAIDGKDHIHKS